MNFLIKCFGIHPLVALGMITVDTMLFAPDATGIGWFVSCAVAAVLTIPCILLQRFAYEDNWGVAIGKGMIIGLLTAIPSNIPSALLGAGGLIGVVGVFESRKEKRLLESP